MKYRVRHLTEYKYGDAVTLSHHIAHLTPRSGHGQTCLARQLDVSPTPALQRERLDPFGNRATYFSIEEPHRRLAVQSTVDVEVAPPPLPRLDAGGPWPEVRARLRDEGRDDLVEASGYTFDSPYVRASAKLAAYAAASFPPRRPLLEAAFDLTRRIHAEFAYDPEATNISTPIAEVLEARRGVCQDFSHLALGCLRALGLAGRYVSGYLRTLPPPGQPRLIGADASHAWISVFLPDYGWVDFDPTNASMPTDGHVTLAWGRDFGDVAPLRGVILGGGPHALAVSVDVAPLAG